MLSTQQSAYNRFTLLRHRYSSSAQSTNVVFQLVLFNLSAAFDTVDRPILMCLLSDRFGIGGTTLNWFQSYLSKQTRLCRTCHGCARNSLFTFTFSHAAPFICNPLPDSTRVVTEPIEFRELLKSYYFVAAFSIC